MLKRDNTVERIQEMSIGNFKGHKILSRIEQQQFRSYFVGTPGRGSVYSFRVTFVPGYCHLYGDIGNVTFTTYANNSFMWMRDHHKGRSYLSGKIIPRSAQREFDEDVARFDLIKLRGDELISEPTCAAALDEVENGAPFVCAAVYNAEPDAFEVLGGLGMRSSVDSLWAYFAVCRFFELYDEAEKAKPATCKSRLLTVAVDLDGTICDYQGWGGSDEFGDLLPGARDSLEEMKNLGWVIIINTCRGDVDKVKAFLDQNNVPYDFINHNPDNARLGLSEKVLADLYIDDRGIAFRGSWADVMEQVKEFRAWWK